MQSPKEEAQFERGKRVRMSIRLLTGLVLGLLAPTGCESRAAPEGVAVFDSAGVRVIDLGADFEDHVKRRQLASEPDLIIRFGEDDPAAVVSRVVDVELLSRDRIAVANPGGNEILVFDSAGHHVGTWGGTGGGPGEFGRLEWLASRPPDSVAAGDARRRRVTMFDANGELVRSFATASAIAGSSRSIPPRPLGLLEDGSIVSALFEPVATGAEGRVRPEVEVLAIPPTGDGVDLVGAWPGDELTLFLQDGLLQVVAPPFGRRLHISVGIDKVWIGDDADWEVRGYSADAHLRTVVRSSASPKLVTDDLLEQRIAAKYEGRVSEGPALEELKRDQRKIAHHTTMPSFGMVVGMADAGVAIGEYQPGTASSRAWLMVDPSGEVTTMNLPAALDVKRLGPAWVIGVVRDELDREEIHRYPILVQGR